MMELWSTPIPGLLLTIGAYLVFQRIQLLAKGNPILHPVPWSILVLGAFLKLGGIPYERYLHSSYFLHFLLGPATVALAVPMARELPKLRRLLLPVGAGLLAGNLTAAISAMFLAKLLGGSTSIVLSLAPKSVTTPIAMGISEKIGGQPSLTAVLVVITGIFGALLGPYLFDKMRIHDPLTRGIATGTAAHGLGTAIMYKESHEAGAYSGLAMGLSGLLTAVFLPWLVKLAGIR
jgi:predicted murein hydrolase (TIGR00659 family)